MKIRAYSKYLIAAVERCARAAYQDPAFWMSSQLRLEVKKSTLRLTLHAVANCLDTVVNCDVEEPGMALFVDCEHVLSILKTLQGTIHLEQIKDDLVLYDDKRRFQVPLYPCENTTVSIPDPTGDFVVQVPPQTLRGLFDGVRFAAGNNAARMGICFVILRFSKGRVRSYATDGHRAARKLFELPTCSREFSVDVPVVEPDGDKSRDNFLKALLHLTNSGDTPLKVTVSSVTRDLYLETEDTLYWYKLPPAHSDDWISIRDKLEIPEPYCLVDTSVVLNALNAVTTILRTKSVDRTERDRAACVQLQIDNGALVVSAKLGRETAIDRIETIEFPAGELKMGCHIEAEFLRHALSHVDTPTVRLSGGDVQRDEPFLVTSDDGSYDCLVMTRKP